MEEWLILNELLVKYIGFKIGLFLILHTKKYSLQF